MTTDELKEAINNLFDRLKQQSAQLESSIDERGKLIAQIVGTGHVIVPEVNESTTRPIHD